MVGRLFCIFSCAAVFFPLRQGGRGQLAVPLPLAGGGGVHVQTVMGSATVQTGAALFGCIRSLARRQKPISRIETNLFWKKSKPVELYFCVCARVCEQQGFRTSPPGTLHPRDGFNKGRHKDKREYRPGRAHVLSLCGSV